MSIADADHAHADGEDDVFTRKNRLLGFGLVRDPLPKLHELRAQCPVHRGSISAHFGVTGPDNVAVAEDEQVTVLGFPEVEEGWRDPARFSSAMYAASISQVLGETILSMDPPVHTRYRSLLQAAFSRNEMLRWERDFVRAIVVAALEKIRGQGRGDLSADFAFYYPITVISTACGLPVEDVPTFYEQAALLTSVAAAPADRLRASAQMEAMVRPLITQRRAEPQDDLISILCHAQLKEADGSRHALSDDEIVNFVRLLVPAGAQTTYRSLTNLLVGLLTHPDQLQALRDDRSLIPQAVEEGLRWEPPIISFTRQAMFDTELGGVAIPEGTKLNLCIHAANHDPARWENPDEFDVFRTPLAHLSFGQGPHICLGIHFARMELRVALEEILERLPNLRLADDAGDVHVDGLHYRTALRIPCQWDVAG